MKEAIQNIKNFAKGYVLVSAVISCTIAIASNPIKGLFVFAFDIVLFIALSVIYLSITKLLQ